jgi:hypothetical protein
MLKGCLFSFFFVLRSLCAKESAMKETVTYVTQSKFFTPAFNAAIFDGPIRIYFAQYQEAQALKLYFNLQERFSEVRKQARGIFKERGQNIFVMLYPTEETFEMSFGNSLGPEGIGLGKGLGAEAGPGVRPLILREKLGLDYVVGVCGPMEDQTFDSLCRQMDQIVRSSEC